MKLLTIINRRYLFTSVILLACCSVVLFFMMNYVIHGDMDENLEDERKQITIAYERNGELPVPHNLKSDRLEMTRLSSAYTMLPRMSDTMVYYSLEHEYIPHRQLSFILSNEKGKYLVKISQSSLESDDLLLSLLIFTLIFISALLGLMYFFNRQISKNTWQSFNATLEKLKSFDLTGQNKISFPHSAIFEFEELNQSLNKMMERIYSDFTRLKQFTENASHEIQTPLSIIRSRIEMMFQSERLNEEQIISIQKINEAVSRLSKLNLALLTLTKIENHQYPDAEKIHLAALIRHKLSALDDIIQQKQISVSIQADDDAFINMNISLADLLFDNLIGNALKHNHQNGFIKISIHKNQFTISNTGAELKVAPEKLFDRFAKNDPSSDSLGLGLAMVNQICLSYGFKIQFISEKNVHTLTISF